jgi:hypothetical protein
VVKVVTQIDSPRGAVFSVLTDFAGYPQWVPGCQTCTLLSTTPNRADVEIVIKSMKVMTMQLRFEWDSDQSIRFAMIKGTDLRSYSGTYRLMDAVDGSGSVLISELDLDAGGMAMKFIVDKVLKTSLEATGVELNKRVRQSRPADGAPRTKTPAPAKRRRIRALLRVLRAPGGVSVWYAGMKFTREREGR